MGQADLPDGFARFWRISLADYGLRDEFVEFLGYLPDGRARISYVRDGCEEAVSAHSLFPLSPAEYATALRLATQPQLELF